MTRLFAQRLLVVHVLLLAVGTQVSGSWRADAVASLQAPCIISSLAYFVLFAGATAVALARPLTWHWARVLVCALGLALLSECLQFFALDRFPRWLDVGIDMSGALTAMLQALLVPYILQRVHSVNL
jgi:hypothetical protein